MRDISTITPGPAALRALTHPHRMKMLAILRKDGPQTATTLATQLGLNSGATSYHLRQLAANGLIERDETRGNRKDRWWKARHEMTRMAPADATGDQRAMNTQMLHGVLAHHAQSAMHALDALYDEAPDWQKTQSFNDFTIPMSAADSQHLTEALLALLWQAKQNAPAPGAALPDGYRQVTFHLHAFATPEDAPL